jgi:Rieske Fe-S protein
LSTITGEVTFTQGLIVVKPGDKNGLKVYSDRCPHLGCRIGRYEEGLLRCPCHGSSYNTDGRVVSGPAAKSLTELEFTIDEQSGELVISG